MHKKETTRINASYSLVTNCESRNVRIRGTASFLGETRQTSVEPKKTQL